jgi:hypothetical protein
MESRLSEESRKVLRAQWQESSGDPVKAAVIRVLLNQVSIPEEDLDAAIVCLQNGSQPSTGPAFCRLSKLSPMPEKAMRPLIMYLEKTIENHLENGLESVGYDFLGEGVFSFSESAGTVQEYLLKTIKDADHSIKVWWISILKEQHNLLESAIDALTPCMIEDADDAVKLRTNMALRYSQLKEETLNTVVTRMTEDPSSKVRYRIKYMLQFQYHLPNAAIDALISRAKEDTDASVREFAIQSLQELTL